MQTLRNLFNISAIGVLSFAIVELFILGTAWIAKSASPGLLLVVILVHIVASMALIMNIAPILGITIVGAVLEILSLNPKTTPADMAQSALTVYIKAGMVVMFVMTMLMLSLIPFNYGYEFANVLFMLIVLCAWGMFAVLFEASGNLPKNVSLALLGLITLLAITAMLEPSLSRAMFGHTFWDAKESVAWGKLEVKTASQRDKLRARESKFLQKFVLQQSIDLSQTEEKLAEKRVECQEAPEAESWCTDLDRVENAWRTYSEWKQNRTVPGVVVGGAEVINNITAESALTWLGNNWKFILFLLIVGNVGWMIFQKGATQAVARDVKSGIGALFKGFFQLLKWGLILTFFGVLAWLVYSIATDPDVVDQFRGTTEQPTLQPHHKPYTKTAVVEFYELYPKVIPVDDLRTGNYLITINGPRYSCAPGGQGSITMLPVPYGQGRRDIQPPTTGYPLNTPHTYGAMLIHHAGISNFGYHGEMFWYTGGVLMLTPNVPYNYLGRGFCTLLDVQVDGRSTPNTPLRIEITFTKQD